MPRQSSWDGKVGGVDVGRLGQRRYGEVIMFWDLICKCTLGILEL